MPLVGIHTALVTPFNNDGSVDVEALKRSVQFQLSSGAAGLCALGGTGEPLSMTSDEHRKVIDIVVSETAGQVPVTVGCLSAGQKDIIATAQYSRRAGANYIMVIPQYFYSATFHHIKGHLASIADACDIPMVLFHSPGRGGIKLKSAEILELLEAVPTIRGIKEASGDMILISEVLKHAPTNVAMMQGFDELLLPTLALGGHGGIVSLAELIPVTLRRLFEHCQRMEFQEARTLQLSILSLCRTIYSEPNPGPLKYALGLAGRSAGKTRLPIYEPLESTRSTLDRLVAELEE